MINIKAANIARLLVLSALLCSAQGVQAAENTMTIAIGNYAGIGGDPTLSGKYFPNIGSYQFHHLFTHCEPLITLDSNGDVIPWLAESYEVSDDYKTITFHLRKGIKFADGKLLNASVLKFFFDRFLTYGYADVYGKNASVKLPLYINYDHTKAEDEYTLSIYFSEGWLDMPKDIAFNCAHGFFIHPEDVDPAWDIRGTLKQEKRFNGLGPYYVDENESIPDQKVVLKRRHSWRDDYGFHKPNLDMIVLKLIKDTQVAAMAMEEGEIDYICRFWNVPLDSLPALEKNPMISIKTAPETRMYYIQTAYWKEPFNGTDGILMRKAICYALNRTELVEGAFNGYALPATDAMLLSPRRSDSPDCCQKGYDYDLDKARRLLAEAGWNDTDGDGFLDRNGESLKNLDLVITSDSRMIWQKDLAMVIQSQLKSIGIDVQIRMVDSSIYFELEKNGDFDLRMTYGGGRFYSITNELLGFKNQASSRNEYSNQNESLATLIDDAQMAKNIKEREKYLCQACNILYEEAGIIPLVYEMQYAVMNSKVNGFTFGPSKNGYFMDHPEECGIL